MASAIIAAKKPVADHKRTTCLMKFLWMVYYTAKDVGMLCASYVNNIYCICPLLCKFKGIENLCKCVEFMIVSQLDNQDGNAINAWLIFDGIS